MSMALCNRDERGFVSIISLNLGEALHEMQSWMPQFFRELSKSLTHGVKATCEL
jgi:hypothetical protein